MNWAAGMAGMWPPANPGALAAAAMLTGSNAVPVGTRGRAGNPGTLSGSNGDDPGAPAPLDAAIDGSAHVYVCAGENREWIDSHTAQPPPPGISPEVWVKIQQGWLNNHARDKFLKNAPVPG